MDPERIIKFLSCGAEIRVEEFWFPVLLLKKSFRPYFPHRTLLSVGRPLTQKMEKNREKALCKSERVVPWGAERRSGNTRIEETSEMEEQQ